MKLIICSVVLLGILNGIGLVINLLEKLPIIVILSGLFLLMIISTIIEYGGEINGKNSK